MTLAKKKRNEEVEGWWMRSLSPLLQRKKWAKVALMMYTTWNIWKEKKRQVDFGGEESEANTGF
uniref:Uncharacterized protein n=1 Tax=Setaria italica TaxID=4555 RepID=K3YKP1_SETIT